MDFLIDRRPIAPQPFLSVEPTHLWVLGVVNDQYAAKRPTERIPSFLSECECPDDCLRDHENE